MGLNNSAIAAFNNKLIQNIAVTFSDTVEISTLRIILLEAMKFVVPLDPEMPNWSPWLLDNSEVKLKRVDWLKAPMGSSVVYDATKKKTRNLKDVKPPPKKKQRTGGGAKPDAVMEDVEPASHATAQQVEAIGHLLGNPPPGTPVYSARGTGANAPAC